MAGHGWNPFNEVIFSDMDFFEAYATDERDYPFNIDNLKSPWEYYKETIYAS